MNGQRGARPQGPGIPGQAQQPPYTGQQPSFSGRGWYPPAGRPTVPGPRKPEKKPDKKQTYLTAGAVILVLVVLVAGMVAALTSTPQTAPQQAAQQTPEQAAQQTAAAQAQSVQETVNAYADRFCPGVYVNGISLDGMTYQEAQEAVEREIRQQHGDWQVTLAYGELRAVVTAEMLGLGSVDAAEVRRVLDEAARQGHTGTTYEERYAEMQRLQQEPFRGYTSQTGGNTQYIDEKLAIIKTTLDRPAQDAQVMVDKTNLKQPFTFTQEQYGLNLDTGKLRDELYQMASEGKGGILEVKPDVLEPAVHREDLMKRYTLRSSATTQIHSTSSDDRNENIRHALEDYVSGTCLQPGETFSFNNIVGERTSERYFRPAPEIVSGTMQEGYGGGVCQASSTLYQAALCAGLEIVERRPHSEKVKYAELGQDATVFLDKKNKRNKDFRFKNNTDGEIWIFATVEKGKKTKKALRARVDIYGPDMGGVKLELRSNIVGTIDPPTEPDIRKDKEGKYVIYKDDPMYQESEAQPGYTVEVWLDDKKNKQSYYVTTDTYEPKKAIWYKGVK